MSKHNFSQAERQAVFNVHGPRCYICDVLLSMKTVEIDHVVPESLKYDSRGFSSALEELGLPRSFDVNSYENWMPACRSCNGKKGNMVWRPSPLIQCVLQRCANKAGEVRSAATRLVTDKKLQHALATLELADEQGELSDDIRAKLQPLVTFNSQMRRPEAKGDPVPVTSSYAVPLYEELGRDRNMATVRGPYGVGIGPVDKAGIGRMGCGSCGYPYFNGARCVICGQMDDGD